MNSLPTGATQSWLIVAAVGLSPMITFFLAGAIGRVLRSKVARTAVSGSIGMRDRSRQVPER
jgi:hypothetical protein